MFFDDLINFGHEADGLVQGGDDFAVMVDVSVAEGAAFAVFEPFVADLVAADVEVPDIFGDAGEAAAAVYCHPTLMPGIASAGKPFNYLIAADELS